LEEVKVNRQYRDRLFKRVFENKEDLLSLYNAINGTDYQNVDDLEVNTLEDWIFMSMKNDVSFLIYDVLNLYEHQSTQNPNMPLRGFLYLADLYRKMFKDHKDLYSSKLIPLPTPQFIVFYNGDASEPDEYYRHMSDAFAGKIEGEPSLECTARMLNINYGHNKVLMDKCKRLKEYALLVQHVKENLASGQERVLAIENAVDYCIENDILADILTEHKAEVTNMLFTEYDEVAHIKNEKEISYEEGVEYGIKQGHSSATIEHIRRIMNKTAQTFDEVCDLLDISNEDRQKYKTLV
jgi:hypothetical protein